MGRRWEDRWLLWGNFFGVRCASWDRTRGVFTGFLSYLGYEFRWSDRAPVARI